MTPSALGQYLRAFMIKLSMVESSLGQLSLGGRMYSYTGRREISHPCLDEGSFAIVIELQNDKAPSVTRGKVRLTGSVPVQRSCHMLD